MEKDARIAATERGHDKFGPLLLEFATAASAAKAMADLIKSTEIRTVVALAIVEDDHLRAAGKV